MAFLAAALPYVAAASTAFGVYSTIEQGKSQQNLLNQQAEQRDEDAKAAQAEAQRESLIERRKAKNLMSRARAVAGASGAGSSDPTVTNILTNIETQGEVNALNALYSGNATARGLRSGAAVARAEGSAARTASYMDAASTGLSGATSWYKKYGGTRGRGYTAGYGAPETASTPDAGDLTIRRPYIDY